jgi:hypothetical protein
LSDEPIYTEGRPDFPGWNRFGITKAKSFPPYVYSANKMGMLIHRVAAVEVHWWEPCDGGERLVRRHRPSMIAITVCGQHKFLKPGRAHACILPRPDAVLCGKCHGQAATFRGHEEHEVSKQYARDHLGCMVEVRDAG